MSARCQTLLIRTCIVTLMLVAGACGGSSDTFAERGRDPLLIKDVEEELQTLPRSLVSFYDAVRVKQSAYSDFGRGRYAPKIERDPEFVKTKLDWSRSGGDFEMREPKKGEEIVALHFLISWDAVTGGERGVHVTGDWTLFLNKKDEIVAYSLKRVGVEQAWEK